MSTHNQNQLFLEQLASLDASLWDINVSLMQPRNLLSDFNQSSSIMALLRELSTESIIAELNRRPTSDLAASFRPRNNRPYAELRPAAANTIPAYLRDDVIIEENSPYIIIEIVSRNKTDQLEIKYGPFNITFAFKNILKKELDITIDNICAICYETPTKGESLTTSCGHDFCRECYIKWGYNKDKAPSCPTCRKCSPDVFMFKHRQQKIFVTSFNKTGQQEEPRKQLCIM